MTPQEEGFDGPLDLRDMAEEAEGEKRFALVVSGLVVAVMQEQRRMGFSDAEAASALALDADGQIDSRMYATWRERLSRYRRLLGLGDDSEALDSEDPQDPENSEAPGLDDFD